MGDNATVMVHINRIREKIEDDSRNPKILETVWEQDTVLINKRCCFIVYESQQEVVCMWVIYAIGSAFLPGLRLYLQNVE